MKPELFESNYLFAALETQRKSCINKNCDNCPLKNDFDEDVCKVDIMMELWRRLDNAVSNQVHAHWYSSGEGRLYDVIRCSHCKEELPHVMTSKSTTDHPYVEYEYIEPTDRCPSCGAIMDLNYTPNSTERM